MSWFKYTEWQYHEGFLNGTLRFQSLAYFRAFDQTTPFAIRDPFEGLRVQVGGQMRVHGQPYSNPHNLHLRATSIASEIFALCLCRNLDFPLGRQFSEKYDTCVEIVDHPAFCERVRSAVLEQYPTWTSRQGRVGYYADAEALGQVWAEPRGLVLGKRHSYAWQREYRFAFAPKSSLRDGATTLTLTNADEVPEPPIQPTLRTLEIGDLRSITRVHRLN